MKAVICAINAITEVTGRISAWALFSLGFIICYEVIARYFFRAPTSWANEVSLLIQVFVVFFASGYVLKHKSMVSIQLILNNPNGIWRKLADSFSLIVLFCLTVPAIWFGVEIWLRSVNSGHSTDTVLGIPRWVTDAAVWVGFSILSLQALSELWRIWTEEVLETAEDPLEGSH